MVRYLNIRVKLIAFSGYMTDRRVRAKVNCWLLISCLESTYVYFMKFLYSTDYINGALCKRQVISLITLLT